MATLSSEQQQQVETWACEGANLNEIQSRLKAEFGITLTFLDARMLLLDIGVKLKEKPKPVEKPSPEVAPPAMQTPTADDWNAAPASSDAVGGQGVSVSADSIPVPGAIASGKAVFSDGKAVVWFVDQNGRLGLNAPDPGYQPPPADIPLFEQQLDALLASL